MRSDSPFDDDISPGGTTRETTQLITSDGVTITVDIDAPASATSVAALLHPHPLYGGRRDHPLLVKLSSALTSAQVLTARNDFRHASGNTIEEMPDAIATCEELQRRQPHTPLYVVGYSFGAIVAARIASQVNAQHLVMIAPPLSTVSLDVPGVPSTIIAAEHDQFSPPSSLSGHPVADASTIRVLAGADHFLNGFIEATTALTVDVITNGHGA
ncbi:MAG: alpha/beta hydrolase [Ilumatobacteraceae bacterium]